MAGRRCRTTRRPCPPCTCCRRGRRLARDDSPPGPALALAASDRLVGGLERATLGAWPRRNVHMVVLESFWDAGRLEAAGVTDDPLGPDFRALWAEGGYSRGLSPVFGGHTANAEFEALCGFPVLREGVAFEGALRRDAPCLPRLLSLAGYASVASHPNDAAFWNRVHAYRRVGFDTYWSAKDFELDDMNDTFLSDASLYRQVLGKVQPLPETGTPTFNYVLTLFGHLGYPLNAARPPVIGTNEEVWLVGPYANTVRYKAQELVAFLAELRDRDPDALVVVFGDDLPFLGFNHDGYVQPGLLAPDRGEFTPEMERTVSATPLLVFDGRAGAVSVGDIPLYQLPALVLDLLGHDGPTIMDYTRTGEGPRVRPFPGYQLVYDDGAGTAALCRDPDSAPGCPAVQDWGADMDLLARDIFSGAGITAVGGLPMPPLPPPPEDARPTGS